jgi:hypothetical protein
MKKVRIAIISWQYLWAAFALTIIVVRSINGIIWSDPYWEYKPDIFDVIMLRGISTFCLLFTSISVVGCFGLIMKKKWAYQLSVLAVGLISLFSISALIYYIIYLSVQGYSTSIISAVITPIIVICLIISIGILAIIYIVNPKIKVLFKA